MEKENIARAKGNNLSISPKHAYEVCNFIRGKSVDKMKKYLADVLLFKKAIPYKKHNMDLPHQKGRQGPSRYPTNTVKAILAVLNSAVSNAEDKGFNTSGMIIKNAISNQGPSVWRFGRQARRKAKRAHVEIVVKETVPEKRKAPEKKAETKKPAELPKKENPEEKTEEKKPVKKEEKTEEKKPVKKEEKDEKPKQEKPKKEAPKAKEEKKQ